MFAFSYTITGFGILKIFAYVFIKERLKIIVERREENQK